MKTIHNFARSLIRRHSIPVVLTLGTAILLSTEQTLAFTPATQDFGDAPAPYPTTLDNNGARHTFSSALRLGNVLDLEANGQPTNGALGDDLVPRGGPDDEDGVQFVGSSLLTGGRGQVDVVITINSATGGDAERMDRFQYRRRLERYG